MNYVSFLKKKNNIKCEKHLYNLNSKENYIGHIRSLKKATNNGLNLQKVHNIINFNQKECLKPPNKSHAELKNMQRMILKII